MTTTASPRKNVDNYRRNQAALERRTGLIAMFSVLVGFALNFFANWGLEGSWSPEDTLPLSLFIAGLLLMLLTLGTLVFRRGPISSWVEVAGAVGFLLYMVALSIAIEFWNGLEFG